MVLLLLASIPAMAQHGKTTISDSTTTALFLNAMKEYNSGNLQKAKEHLQLLLAIDSNNDAACYYLANISIKTDDAVSGELYLKKGIGIDSSNFWYRDMLGQIYIKNKKINLIGICY